jgi:hypothetical protein
MPDLEPADLLSFVERELSVRLFFRKAQAVKRLILGATLALSAAFPTTAGEAPLAPQSLAKQGGTGSLIVIRSVLVMTTCYSSSNNASPDRDTCRGFDFLKLLSCESRSVE